MQGLLKNIIYYNLFINWKRRVIFLGGVARILFPIFLSLVNFLGGKLLKKFKTLVWGVRIVKMGTFCVLYSLIWGKNPQTRHL